MRHVITSRDGIRGGARSPGGSFQGLVPLVLLMLSQVCACGPLYRIEGTDMGAMHQNLRISREGQPVDDAAVTVNGVDIARTGSGFHQGQLPASVPVGSPLHLEVRSGSATVRGTGMVPETPGLVAPVTGSTFTPRDTIPVRWTSATTPDRFVVFAGWRVGEAGHGKWFPAPADARSLAIPASELPTGLEVTINVFAYNDGSFTGPVVQGSRMSIRGHDYVTKAVITIAP